LFLFEFQENEKKHVVEKKSYEKGWTGDWDILVYKTYNRREKMYEVTK